MVGGLGRLVVVAMVVVDALAGLFVGGMRAKCPSVVDRVRRFNRAVTTPRVLRSAGSPGASASGDRPRRPGIAP